MHCSSLTFFSAVIKRIEGQFSPASSMQILLRILTFFALQFAIALAKRFWRCCGVLPLIRMVTRMPLSCSLSLPISAVGPTPILNCSCVFTLYTVEKNRESSFSAFSLILYFFKIPSRSFYFIPFPSISFLTHSLSLHSIFFHSLPFLSIPFHFNPSFYYSSIPIHLRFALQLRSPTAANDSATRS